MTPWLPLGPHCCAPIRGHLLQARGQGDEPWRGTETWVIVSMLILECCVTLTKSLLLSGTQLSPCRNRGLGFQVLFWLLSFYNSVRHLDYLCAIKPQTLSLRVPSGHLYRSTICKELSLSGGEIRKQVEVEGSQIQRSGAQSLVLICN